MCGPRPVKAVHGLRSSAPDAGFELLMAAEMRERLSTSQLLESYARSSGGSGYIATLLRRVSQRAMARKFGTGISVGRNVSVFHPETIEFGDRVFIGDQAQKLRGVPAKIIGWREGGTRPATQRCASAGSGDQT